MENGEGETITIKQKKGCLQRKDTLLCGADFLKISKKKTLT